VAYDQGLAHRLHEHFADRGDVEAKKMFGGLCFMVRDHMCCGIVGDTLMARVGPLHYDEYLKLPHAKEMDFTGRAMKGMIYVCPEGFVNDSDLLNWINRCEDFILTLPPKKPKAPKTAGKSKPEKTTKK